MVSNECRILIRLQHNQNIIKIPSWPFRAKDTLQHWMYKCWQHWPKNSTNRPTFHFCPSLMHDLSWSTSTSSNKANPFHPSPGKSQSQCLVQIPCSRQLQAFARDPLSDLGGCRMKDGATLHWKLDDLMILNFHIYFPIPCLVTECFKYLQHVELDLQFVIRGKLYRFTNMNQILWERLPGGPLFCPPKGPKCTVLLFVIRSLVAVFAWLAIAWHGYSLNIA